MKTIAENTNEFGDPLFSAVKDGRTNEVIKLVDSYDEKLVLLRKNFFGQTLLHVAVNYDHLILVKYFIRIGCNINNYDYLHQTALHIACIKAQKTKNLRILQYLLNQNNIEINKKDTYGNLPIHYLVRNFDLFLYCFNFK